MEEIDGALLWIRLQSAIFSLLTPATTLPQVSLMLLDTIPKMEKQIGPTKIFFLYLRSHTSSRTTLIQQFGFPTLGHSANNSGGDADQRRFIKDHMSRLWSEDSTCALVKSHSTAKIQMWIRKSQPLSVTPYSLSEYGKVIYPLLQGRNLKKCWQTASLPCVQIRNFCQINICRQESTLDTQVQTSLIW